MGWGQAFRGKNNPSTAPYKIEENLSAGMEGWVKERGRKKGKQGDGAQDL